MVFKLFNKKNCAQCGKKVEKGDMLKHSGKRFCLKEHVEEYSKKQEAEQPKNDGGSCCE